MLSPEKNERISLNERLSFANIRNRAEQTQLECVLHRIEKQKQNALRVVRREKKIFRSKYSKLSNETPGVKMYETHNPGFCFRRNGDQKNVRQVETTKPIDFKHIHFLIFTNGEVDIQKILCLHLLSAHRGESLTPPKKRMRYICKEHSPTERLISRSRRGFSNFEKLSNLLPLYTVESTESEVMGEYLINDGRIAVRILINEKLRQLLNAVVNALEKANPEKLQQIVDIGNSLSALKKMVSEDNVCDFLSKLYKHSLVNNCESFILSPPFKIKTRDFRVKTLSGSLEQLVSHIRQNVLQLPADSLWRKRLKDEEEEEVEVEKTPPRASSTSVAKPKMEPRRLSDIASGSKNSAKIEVYTKKDSTRRHSEEERRFRRHITPNFIEKNKEAAAKVRKIEYDSDDKDELPLPRRTSTDSGRIRRRSMETASPVKLNMPPLLPVKESEHKENETEDGEKIEDKEKEITTASTIVDDPTAAKKKSSVDSQELKFHIKQTTCPACMEKWKTPLPSPKTPRVKKSSVLPDEYSVLRTNSHNRISMMINKELYNLQSYDRRYSTESESSRRGSLKKKEVDAKPLDKVYLNPMDLAKIEQEIKERETQKKLEKFLKETV